MRVSASFKERDFMEQWMNLVVSQTTQELQYPDSYRCNAEIEAYTLTEDFSPYSVRLTDVWPKGVGRVTVGQGLTDAIATMQVQLAFRRYYIVGSPNDPGEDKMNRGADTTPRPEFDRPQPQSQGELPRIQFDFSTVPDEPVQTNVTNYQTAVPFD